MDFCGNCGFKVDADSCMDCGVELHMHCAIIYKNMSFCDDCYEEELEIEKENRPVITLEDPNQIKLPLGD